ncbi:protein disulfide-isomerase A6 homolog [Ctenocephalides felis]|uniref:protein disulfide-isomerase A6 homolog n=1 Tax=Ctenocephalides felis TaxID=7515 RepID=UPI000E6E3743|nr:protein disulfide-isomerase A6 homolog [Ctenocephalides felis]
MIVASTALYSSYSDVYVLTPENFDNVVLNSDKVWVVQFYAPWCKGCQKLVPEYSKAALALRGVAQVGAVDAIEHKSLSEQYNVQGYPTIKIFSIDKKSPQDFSGPRTAQGIVESAFSAAKNLVLSKLGVHSKTKILFDPNANSQQ